MFHRDSNVFVSVFDGETGSAVFFILVFGKMLVLDRFFYFSVVENNSASLLVSSSIYGPCGSLRVEQWAFWE